MIIAVNQTKSNFANEFCINYDNKTVYNGKVSALSSLRQNSLLDLNGNAVLNTKRHPSFVRQKVFGYIQSAFIIAVILVIIEFISNNILKIVYSGCFVLAYGILTGFIKRKRKRNCVFNAENSEIAEFYQHADGFLKWCYIISTESKIFKLYTRNISSYEHISIYSDGIQVGQIDRLRHMTNNKRNYTLYLLDGQKDMANLLSLFVLYYDSMNNASRGGGTLGKSKEWSWSYSKTNKYYNPTWVQIHFADDNWRMK